MSIKKLLSLLTALVMLFTATCAVAEDMQGTRKLLHTGGVILRGFARSADALSGDLIEVAYVSCNAAYITLNEPATWEISVAGGAAPYQYELVLFHQDLSAGTGDYYYGVDSLLLDEDQFVYTITDEGRYFWEVTLTDSNGQYVVFQTRPYETNKAADATDTTTVAGKVNSIIASEITASMSDYSRARALHDWLIYNANYDYTYTYYGAEGVLLYGKGVCESYSRAYQMLLTAAGIENVIVTGTAGGGAHAWNLVKLGGSWYHIDCTWDDPNEGGYERHTYFCLTDEEMAVDHDWNRGDDIIDDGMVVPDADGGEFGEEEAASDYDFTFSSMDEYGAAFDAMISSGIFKTKTVGLYTGTADPSDVWTEFGTWTSAKVDELAQQSLLTAASRSYIGNLFTFSVTWVDADSYLRIDETALRLSIGESANVVPSQYEPAANAFIWTSSDPSVATVTSSYTEAAGLVAVITAHKTGTTTITATSEDGLSDSLTVTVLAPYSPEFALTLTEADNGVTLAWEHIPGVTEYQIYRTLNGNDTLLTTVTENTVTLTSDRLPSNRVQKVYVIAVRKVDDTVAVSYTSNTLSYGTLNISYSSTLPAAMQTIGDSAFSGNIRLTSLDIPSGVKTIGANAFSGCSSLKAVRVPASVTSIGSNAFSGCPLETVEVVEGSYADTWFAANHPNVERIY